MNERLGWSRGWSWVSCLLVAVAMMLPGGAALWAQQTTGNVSGIVRDTTGAIVPQATVTLRDTASGSERKAVSNSSGEFSIPSVASALSYQLTVTETGFDTWQSRQFPLRPGDQITFTDIKLAVGSVSTDVTVEDVQSQAVKPLDTPERSDVITSKDLETLAIQGRDATELIRFLPGFSLISPGLNNQAPNDAVVGVSSASTGSYSSNGTGGTGIATILDGVSLTDIRTNAGTTQTINPEMVSEIKVTTSTYSADYAHGPTVIDATTKSGGLKFHGSGYLYARNTDLNANDWYNNFLQLPRPEGRYFYPGATLGGPLWIPGTRFHRDTTKLFFFAGFEAYNQLYSPQTLGSWVPTMAERQGDFSVANLNAQLCGARPDGKPNPNAIQPMCNAENYLPTGGFNAPSVQNGNLKGLGNSSGIALLNWLPLPNADPFTNASGYNYIQEVIQHQNGSVFHTRLDYAINDSNKLAITYGLQKQTTEDPVSFGPIAPNSVLYPGQLSSGDISNVLSLSYTRVFSPSVVNEFGLGYSVLSVPGNEGNPAAVSRFSMNAYNCTDPAARKAGTCGTSGNGNFSYLGEFKYAGDYSVPNIQDYSNLGYPNIQVPGGFYNNQIHQKATTPDITDTVSLQRGRHSIKLGVYYEAGIVNGLAVFNGVPQGQYTFNPQNSYFDYSNSVGTASQFQPCVSPDPAGNNRNSGAAYLGQCMTPNALMYLGYADSYTQTNFSPDVDMRYQTLAGFANDSWHIRHFTFQLGMRFEHLGSWTDRHNNGLAQFSSALYYTQCAGAVCGSANAPGVSWHGVDPSIPNSVSQPTKVYASPRLGLAWDIFGTGDTVLRGGWGIYRHQEEFAPYAAAAATAQGFKTTYQQNTLTFDSVEQQSPINPADFNIDVLNQADTRRPVYYEYNAAISQRLHFGALRNSLVEVAYVGNNTQHLSSYSTLSQNYNEVSDTNFIPGGTLFDTGVVSRIQGAVNSIASLTTNQLDSVRAFPFYQHIYTLNHNLYSNYNSLQASWNKNDGPVQFGVNYTLSKNLATAQTYGAVADPVNLRNDYSPTPSDRTNIINAHYLIDFGKRYKGDHRALGLLENGWQLSGISTRQSGPPLASLTNGNFGFGYGQIQPVQVYDPYQSPAGSAPTCSNVFGIPKDKNGNNFCVTNVNPVVWLGSPDLLLQPTVNCNPANAHGAHQFVNPTCFGIPVPGSPATGEFALSPNPTGQGQYRLPYIHGPAFMRHDLTLLKNIGVGGEGRNLQLRLAAFNFLNNPQVSFNNNDTSNLSLAFQGATVGQPLTQSSLTHQNFGNAGIKYGARVLELSAHYQF